jgi:predicted Rossmann-fold nucleotide-binding protein
VKNIQRLAVYCGSASGSDVVYAHAAHATAEAMVSRGVDLVYGGGRLGLMGLIADSVLDLADAFLALPGGIGTLDELFEAWSWNALGYHAKPFCLLNVEGFWDGLIAFIDHATECGFLSAQRRAQLLVATSADEALELLDDAAAAATQGMVW